MIIQGQLEKSNGQVVGRYKVDLNIIADRDSMTNICEELESMIEKHCFSTRTSLVLEKLIEELDCFEEIGGGE